MSKIKFEAREVSAFPYDGEIRIGYVIEDVGNGMKAKIFKKFQWHEDIKKWICIELL